MYDEYPLENAEYELVPGQWNDEDVLAEYKGDIISDLSLELADQKNGWHRCER